MIKKTIGIDLTLLDDNFSGLEREALEFSKNMIEDERFNFVLLFKNKPYEYFVKAKRPNVSFEILSGSRIKVLLIEIPKYLKKAKLDYFIFAAFPPSFFIRKNKRIKYITEIADLVCWDCPETMSFKSKWYFRICTKHAIKISDHLLTISEFTKSRIKDRFKIADDKITIASPAAKSVDFVVSDNNIFKKYGLPRKYILSLSTIEPRKNLPQTIQWMIKSWSIDSNIPDLVLAGRKGWKTDGLLNSVPEEYKKRIHFTGFVDDCDLPSLYANSALFLFPSKYEGFGIPILEATNFGSVVLASDIPTSREILPGYNYLFSLTSFNDFYSKMTEILKLSCDERLSIIKASKIQTKNFDWEKSSVKILDCLSKL